jgi:hypothetical protein
MISMNDPMRNYWHSFRQYHQAGFFSLLSSCKVLQKTIMVSQARRVALGTAFIFSLATGGFFVQTARSVEEIPAANISKDLYAAAPDEGEPPAPAYSTASPEGSAIALTPSAMPPADLHLSGEALALSEIQAAESMDELQVETLTEWTQQEDRSTEVLAGGTDKAQSDFTDNPLRSSKDSRQSRVLQTPTKPSEGTSSSNLQFKDKPATVQPKPVQPRPVQPKTEEPKPIPVETDTATAVVEGDQPPAPPGSKADTQMVEKPKRNFDPEDNEHPEGLEKDKDSSSEGSGLKLSESKKPTEMADVETNEPAASELLKLIPEQAQENSPENRLKKVDLGSKGASKTDIAKPSPAPTTKPEALPTQPTKTLPKLTQQVGRLKPKIDAALAYYLNRPEATVQRSPWAVMHAIIPFGVESTLKADGRTVNAIGWMCFNGSCRGQRIFQVTPTGFKPALGAGLQGHEGQFLAILAQSKVAPEYPLQVGRKRYSVNDLIDYEMKTCKSKTELTFKLLSLSHYLPSDAQWQNEQGEAWSIEKLVEEELAQPIVGAACGGTHRLMGLSYALNQRRAEGFPIEGHFARAQVFLNDFIDYAWTLQNPDGSFSTDWFEGRANQSDMQRKLQTTGHILEWLVFVLPEDQLQSPRVVRAVEFLLYCLVDQRQVDWKIGPRGHALHALSLYEERLFGAVPGQLRRQLTASGAKSKQR